MRGILCVLLASVHFLTGCEALNNANRDYQLQYDAATGRWIAGVRVTGAKPGEGRASIAASLAGSVEPDFKQPVEAMRGITF